MADIADFVFGKKLKIAAGEFEFIELDVSERETYTHEAVVSEHAIESGSNVADHVHVLPVKLAIDGLISNFATAKTFVNLDFTRAEDSYQLLQDWQRLATRLTVSTGLDEFDDQILKSFTVTRDKETGNALALNMSFARLDVVDSQLSSAKPAIQAAKAKKETAKRAKKVEKRTSLLEKAKNLVSKYSGGL
jgi:hypothetical protein